MEVKFVTSLVFNHFQWILTIFLNVFQYFSIVIDCTDFIIWTLSIGQDYKSKIRNDVCFFRLTFVDKEVWLIISKKNTRTCLYNIEENRNKMKYFSSYEHPIPFSLSRYLRFVIDCVYFCTNKNAENIRWNQHFEASELKMLFPKRANRIVNYFRTIIPCILYWCDTFLHTLRN